MQPGTGSTNAGSATIGRVVWLALGVPLAGLLAVVAALTIYCHGLLEDAAAGRSASIGAVPVFLVAAAFLFASGVIVAIQSLRVASRVAGPEYRLRQALQRIASGDLAFRVALRRGDLMTGLAHDCNDLLDWLEQNPPRGAVTGNDVVCLPGRHAEATVAAAQESVR
ncbi:MAG: hypothetical protein Q7T30_04630 [Planctomycetota bacterium]|nr:hypothetical protein [Planctomycetota bacterium]